jgi:hypothetical protein
MACANGQTDQWRAHSQKARTDGWPHIPKDTPCSRKHRVSKQGQTDRRTDARMCPVPPHSSRVPPSATREDAGRIVHQMSCSAGQVRPSVSSARYGLSNRVRISYSARRLRPRVSYARSTLRRLGGGNRGWRTEIERVGVLACRCAMVGDVWPEAYGELPAERTMSGGGGRRSGSGGPNCQPPNAKW